MKIVLPSGVDVVSMSYTDFGDCNELKETPLPNVDNMLLEE